MFTLRSTGSLLLLNLALAACIGCGQVEGDVNEGQATAAEKPAATPTAESAREAEDVLRSFSEYVKGLKGFQLTATGKLHADVSNQQVDITTNQEMRIERPNKFSVELAATQPAQTIKLVSDGDKMLIYLESLDKERYAVESAPKDIASVRENPIVIGFSSGGAGSALIGALLSDDPKGVLTENVEKLEYVGFENRDGVKSHHLKATGPQFDWEMWIDAGEEPAPRAFLMDVGRILTRMAKEQGQDIQGKLTFENRLTIDKWSGNPEFAAEAFALAAPEGAEKVNTLMELFGQRPSQQEEPHALLGKAAPAFDLPTLDGKSAKLSDWKDKIVILDFWATWCGPCRSAMPIIIDVANSFKGKGVQLYAVNIDEDAATIESFLNDEKLSVDVALDKAGKVAEEYLAAAIPQTVLIGKDGRVQVVHVGFSANLRETLTEQIEALLAGEDLAAKALQPEKDPNAEESAAAPAE